MNYSAKVNAQMRGKMVWKRNANTSQTNRKSAVLNKNKTRLTSEASDYSYFPQTQNNYQLNSTIPIPQNSLEQWAQVKSLAKHSTIASRMELKKSVPISFLEKSLKKNDKLDESRANSKTKSFSRVIDANGNITSSFKESTQFKSINPHIPKDVQKIKQKTFNMYKNQKKIMDEFLGEDSETITMATLNEDRVNSRAKSLLINYNRDSSMQKISERQEYESRMNSTRNKKDKNSNVEGSENDVMRMDEKRTKELSSQAKKYVEEEPVKGFVKSRQRSVYEHGIDTKSKSGVRPLTESQQKGLLRGLLGEYANYEKMSKHELIQKLISLEYLAQNIFKKNKHLEQELGERQAGNFQEFTHVPLGHGKMSEREMEGVGQSGKMKNEEGKKLKSQGLERNLFVIENEDGYFNEFLESQKGRNNCELMVSQYESPQRFRERSENESPERLREDPLAG